MVAICDDSFTKMLIESQSLTGEFWPDNPSFENTVEFYGSSVSSQSLYT
jgi:hypothetical protein